jgi:oligopeptide/dipeptide ABC transporter ATP-binding protein
VDDISFTIKKGETVGLVGESGSGKSTTANMVMRLIDITSGSIFFEGTDISRAKHGDLKEFRKRTGIVFQDPYSSLDPRKNIFQLISEPMVVHKWGTKDQRALRVYDLLERVGLKKTDARRYPHQFSGGQRQRIAIARALALTPSLVVADEAVSALDVSVQAKILNLFLDIQREFNLSYLFITHDLSVLRHISNQVVVMYLGKIMEYGTVDDIFERSRHPYTRALLQAIPVPNPKLVNERTFVPLKGEIPSPINPPSGCRFRTRCPYAQPKCASEIPLLEKIDEQHFVSCHYWREIYEGITPLGIA